MSDLLKRIADYFANDYQVDDKTAPTMEITVNDLRYIANMNVERCRAEAELRNLKYNKHKDDACEWKYNDAEYYWESSCDHLHIFMSDGPKENEYRFCPYCGKKIKIVGD